MAKGDCHLIAVSFPVCDSLVIGEVPDAPVARLGINALLWSIPSNNGANITEYRVIARYVDHQLAW